MSNNPFDGVDDELRKDAGCAGELDYIEQSSWVLFLKYLDSMENHRKLAAEIQGKSYTHIIDDEYRWETWAAPKKNGKIDWNLAMTGDDLRDFVNNDLFPYLGGFSQRATSPDTIEYKIGEIFGEIKNKMQQGYTMRNVINFIDEFQFGSNTNKHEMSQLYEDKIKRMGNAGRSGGEYYTPRPLIRAMIQITDPKIGDTVYDGAVGSAGFLCEAYEYLSSQPNLSTRDLEILQKNTFYGKEKKPLAYVIGIMNMILHGIDAPNITHINTLGENIMDIQEKDRHNVILANPPFGGNERKEIQQNFPIRTGETAYLFLQHFIKMLKVNGRGAVVIKNTFLFNEDNASVELRRELLESCNLHTILDCPKGTFQGAAVPTVVLFFKKGTPTQRIWYYQLNPGQNLGKTNPLTDNHLEEFVKLQKSFSDSDNSWTVDIEDVDTNRFNLSVKNPNMVNEVPIRKPSEILDDIEIVNSDSAEILRKIRGNLE